MIRSLITLSKSRDPLPNLDALLNLIHLQGIPVGAAERLRLQQILNTQPRLNGNEFRDLLATVLAKNEEQRQRIAFIFERFTRDTVDYETTSGDAQASNSAVHRNPTTSRVTSPAVISTPKKQREYLPWIIGAFGLVILALLIGYFHDTKEAEGPDREIPVVERDRATSTATPPADLKVSTKEKPLISHLPVWSIEKVTITTRPIMQEFVPPFMLFLAATAGFLWLLSKALKQTRQRKPEPVIYQRAMGYHTPPTKHAQYKLFNAQERQTLSWGVGHYFDDQQAQRIDIDRSVAASAHTGFPVIEFAANRYEREVWIWQDRLNHSPLQTRMIQEIRQVLIQANIHVQHGFFNGIPEQIMDQQQRPQYQVMGALPQPLPLVLLCLDAHSVNGGFSQASHQTDQVFQHLKQWSTLAVIDCNPEVSSLKQTLSHYHIPYLLPTQVADWFSRQGAGKVARKVCVLAHVYRWACACALAQRIVTEDEAYALHEALQLNCAWQYSHLSAYGHVSANGLDFSNHYIERINDLSEADRQCAIDFWQTRFHAIDQVLANDKQYPDWENSYSRYQNIHIPIALLKLWNSSPDEAINTLYDYYQHSDLQRPIKQHLSCYCCNDGPDTNSREDFIGLPFDWHDLTNTSKQQLSAMGFAGQVKQWSMKMDAASSLLLGGLGALVLFALHQSITVLWDTPPEIRTRLNSATPPTTVAYNQQDGIFLGTAQYHLEDVLALIQQQGTNAAVDSVNSLSNKYIDVNWARHIVPAQETIQSKTDPDKVAQLWRLATRSKPPARPPCKPSTHTPCIVASHALIKASPENAEAQALAIQLLDSGSADQVLISQEPRAFQRDFLHWVWLPDTAESAQQVQRIVMGKHIGRNQSNLKGIPNTLIYQGDLGDLLARFNTAELGIQTPEQLHRIGFTTKGKPFLRLVSQRSQPAHSPILLDHGMKLMPIPAGSFQMGSNEGSNDERPVHTVTIQQPFWMSETEVTFDQYQAYVNIQMKKLPDDEGWGRKNRPVINVSWQDAVDYTRWLTRTNSQGMACRLPSEAEWEYAARAGTTTPFYWGDKDPREYANYGKEECCEGVAKGNDQWVNTAPVKQFNPNAFGLYDMSGNVWEWTQDKWHGNYQGAPDNGTAWETGDSPFRVLRGGSWIRTSDSVRSANRHFGDFGYNFIGFRIVCSPIDH